MNHDRELPDLEKLAEHDMMAALGMMAVGLAHEINTPLGAVRCTHSNQKLALDRLFALLDERAPDLAGDDELRKLRDAVSEGDRVVETAVARMIALVGQLRRFLARECPETEPVDLVAVVDGALLLLSHELKHRIEVVRDYGELPPVIAFPEPINQIVVNLLLNASQAIAGEGRITVSTRAEGDRAVIRVRDDGPGVPEDLREHIFDHGFTTKGETGGTGHGLALSRYLAGKLRGTLELESPAGGGAVFTLSFPRDLTGQGLHPCDAAGDGA